MIIPAFPTRGERYGYAASLALTLARVALAAPLTWIAISRGSGRVVAALLVAGFLSDVFDGVIARRYGVATAELRRLDSAADSLFYLAAAACAWRLHPASIRANAWLIGAVIATLAINHAFELWKFGREASYHAWLAKAWGASLFVSLLLLFSFADHRLLTVALWVGVASHLENFLITLRLREWRHDVRSVFLLDR